jgi:nicotinamidase-related amidase
MIFTSSDFPNFSAVSSRSTCGRSPPGWTALLAPTAGRRPSGRRVQLGLEHRGSGRFVEGSAGSEVHPAVAPKPGDVVVTKHRVSAFAGTDLDMVLRANGIETLVVAGISTSGVVLSTVRHGADADYRLVVVADCCSDGDAEVHRVLTEKVFVRQTTVTTAEAVVGALAV